MTLTCILAWLKDKLNSKQFSLAAIYWPASFIPEEIWKASLSMTNGNEQAHCSINHNGINLTLLGGIMQGKDYDERAAISIETHTTFGINTRDQLSTHTYRATQSVNHHDKHMAVLYVKFTLSSYQFHHNDNNWRNKPARHQRSHERHYQPSMRKQKQHVIQQYSPPVTRYHYLTVTEAWWRNSASLKVSITQTAPLQSYINKPTLHLHIVHFLLSWHPGHQQLIHMSHRQGTTPRQLKSILHLISQHIPHSQAHLDTTRLHRTILDLTLYCK